MAQALHTSPQQLAAVLAATNAEIQALEQRVADKQRTIAETQHKLDMITQVRVGLFGQATGVLVCVRLCTCAHTCPCRREPVTSRALG